MNSLDLCNWLQETVIFRGLAEETLIPVTQIAQLQTFKKEEIIFRQNSEATGFFVVKSGRVKVFKVAVNGKEQILQMFGKYEHLAEVPALDGQCFPASAAAIETTELIFLPRQPFLKLLYKHPEISVNMLLSLSKHLRHLSKLIEELSFKDVSQRLATYLLNLSAMNSINSHNKDQDIVILDISKSQLAALLGTIPATLSRAFYRLHSEGMISMNGSVIELIDRDRLHNLSMGLDDGI